MRLNHPLTQSSLKRNEACVQVLNPVSPHDSWTGSITPQWQSKKVRYIRECRSGLATLEVESVCLRPLPIHPGREQAMIHLEVVGLDQATKGNKTDTMEPAMRKE
jgi:hypothetical protein